MLTIFPAKLEEGRVRTGEFGSPTSSTYGVFLVQGPCGEKLKISSSGGDGFFDTISNGWQHVCISTKRRVPNWQEMCFVKDLFWGPEECVMQLHPPKSEYVNNNPFCLHLWKPPIGQAIPMPPSVMVGYKDAGEHLSKQQARKMLERR